MEVSSAVIISAVNLEDKYNPKFVLTDEINPRLPRKSLDEALTSIEICANLIKEILGVNIYDGYSGWVPVHLSDVYDDKLDKQQREIVIVYSAMIPEVVTILNNYKWYTLDYIFKNKNIEDLSRNIIHKVGVK